MGHEISASQILEMLRVENSAELTEREMQAAATFLRLWPEGGDALNHFRRKPTCGTCRRGVVNLLRQQPAKVKEFLAVMVPGDDLELSAKDISAAKADRSLTVDSERQVPRLPGRLFDIDDTPEAYADFMDTLKTTRAQYRGMAVRTLENGKVRLYFY